MTVNSSGVAAVVLSNSNILVTTNALVWDARLMILANQIGIIHLNELIAWADEIMLNAEESPECIVDLALGLIPERLQGVGATYNEVDASECARLMRMISERYYNKEISLSEFGRQAYKLALISEGCARELLHWISDEIYLCGEGVKSFSESEKFIKKAVDDIVKIAD